MSDARVTLPVETFALLLRTQITRFSSESDDSLVDICASENPQCQLTRDGGYVSLENLSSIFSPKTDLRAHTTALPLQPADSALTSGIASPQVPEDEIRTNEIIESELKNLFSILAPESNHQTQDPTPPAEPAHSVPTGEIASTQVPADEVHTNDSLDSELKKVFSILSAEANREADHPALVSKSSDSVPTIEIAPTQIPTLTPEDEVRTNEIIVSELKNLFSILTPELNRQSEKTIPISGTADFTPTLETASEQTANDEIRPDENSEIDETPPKVSKLKPILGGVGVVATVVALIGFAVYSIQRAQFEGPAGTPGQSAGSISSAKAAKPETPAAPSGQGSQAALVSQIKAPPGAWIDPATGLMWTLRDNRSDVNWQRAAEYCHNLRLAGHDDWRLPMIDELQGIYDASIKVPGHCCGGTQVAMQVKGNLSLSGWQWSSAQRAQYGTPFSFYNGGRYTNLLSDSDGGRALCVRTLGQLIAQPTYGAEE